MSLKETIFSMMIEALDNIDEAVEVSHDRYMRSHGKKARDSGGGSGNWMFTHKSMGDVDYKNDKEVHNARGKFADAKKSAQAWAKEHGHRTVYVMESVEQIDEISDEKKKEYIRAVADKGGILRKPRPGSLKGFDRKKDDALVKAFKGGSMQDYANLHKKSEKRAGIALNTLNSLKKEEVDQLDEIGDTAKGRRALKAVIARAPEKAANSRLRSDVLGRRQFDPDVSSADSERYGHAADKHYRKYQLAVKGAARAVDRLTKEEVELDEADAVVTHKWYSVKNWKDGSKHFDNLDNHLRGHSYKHPALGNTAKNRPDHHIGIPIKAKSAVAYMDKHATAVNE